MAVALRVAVTVAVPAPSAMLAVFVDKVTVRRIASITIALLAPNEPVVPGAASVRMALLPAAS